MHDAAQHAAVPAYRTGCNRKCRGEAKSGLCRGKAGLLYSRDAAGAAAQEMAVRLANPEAAAAEPVECGPGPRHRLVHPCLRRKGDPAACLVHLVEKFGVLAAGLAARQAEAAAAQTVGCHAQQDVAGVAGADFAVHADRQGGMEIAAPHPVRRIWTIE